MARVRGVDLLTVGEAFEDLIFVDLPKLPGPGEEVRTGTFRQTVGGGALITAVAAARMGTRCGVVSGLSPAGAALLRREHIAITDLRRPGEPHAISAALSTPGNRSFVTFNGVNDILEPRLFHAMAHPRANHVHFALCPTRCARWQPVLRRLRRAGITTSWDFGWNERLLDDPGLLPLIALLDYLFVNEQEVLLYGRTTRADRAVDYWKAHSRVTIVKLGFAGSRWASADLDVSLPPPRVRAVDTTGAGDAFNGGFLAARLLDLSPVESLRAGNRVGALSTRAAGGIDGLPRATLKPRAPRVQLRAAARKIGVGVTAARRVEVRSAPARRPKV